MVCPTSKGSDQYEHLPGLIRAFASRLNMAHAFCVMVQGDTFCMLGNLACFLSSADFFFIFYLKIMTEKKLNADIKQHEK